MEENPNDDSGDYEEQGPGTGTARIGVLLDQRVFCLQKDKIPKIIHQGMLKIHWLARLELSADLGRQRGQISRD